MNSYRDLHKSDLISSPDDIVRMGDVREPACEGCLKNVYAYIDEAKHIRDPYWLVYSADVDKYIPNKINHFIIPYMAKEGEVFPKTLGVLVWYVDNAKGIVEFQSQYSMPYDIPLNPYFLSDDPKDMVASVAETGKKSNLLII